MSAGLTVAVALALLFAATNGLHDASNAIATIVSTRGATPKQAVCLAAVFNVAGPFVLGAAVADTIASIVTVDPAAATRVISAGLLGAVAWNGFTWHAGLPSSSGHALVGGLVGAALLEGGTDAVLWGGLDGLHPVGLLGTLIALALSPVVGTAAGALTVRGLRRIGRRATTRWHGPVRAGQWTMSSALALSHGANDAQKVLGVILALLVANGHAELTQAPPWATGASALALTAGTVLGGWRIMRTVGRRIYRIHPLEALASESASAGAILGASLVGAPVSTSQVVASSVVGIGLGRDRPRHVHWEIVRRMGLAWIVTLPVTAALGAGALALWQLVV